MISIVIPSYNEAAVIERTLQFMLRGAEPGELEIIVVCNACSDDTAERARAFGPPVRVIETPVGSKTHALNLGDEAAEGFPRFYIDADIQISIDAIRRVAAVLESGHALAAAPRLRADLSRCNWWVRAHYSIWTTLPYHRDGMVGAGVYAVSRTGRDRFDRFPDIISDDEFFRLHYAPQERMTIEDVHFTIVPPTNLRGVIHIKTRSYKGDYELKARFPELYVNERKDYSRPLREIASNVKHWAPLAVYTSVNLMTKIRAYYLFRTGQLGVWERDESSRRQGSPSTK